MRIRTLMAVVLPLLGGCDQLASPSRYTEVVVEGVRRDGTPVPGLRALLYTGHRTMGHAITDASGRAVFDHVPEGPAYGVFVQEPEGYLLPEAVFGGPPTNVAPEFAVLRDSVHVVRFTLLREGTGSVEVEVRDDAGAPLAGQPMTLYSPSSIIGTALTDASGFARFSDVPLGIYGVATEPRPGYRDIDDPAVVYEDGLFVEEGSEVHVGFVLARCAGIVDVLVHDPAAGPAANVLVTLYDAQSVRDSLRTDESGRGRFTTACGEVGLRVSPSPQWRPVPGRNGEYVDGIRVGRDSPAAVTLLVERVQ